MLSHSRRACSAVGRPPLSCLCCSPESVEISGIKNKHLPPSIPPSSEPMFICSGCGQVQLVRHAIEFMESVVSKSLKDSPPDSWCCAVDSAVSSGNVTDDFSISACIGCEFSRSASHGSSSFIMPPAHPDAFVPGKRKTGFRASRQAFREHDSLPHSSVCLASNPSFGIRTLSGYFHGSRLHTTRFPKTQSIVNNEYVSSNFCIKVMIVV